jgi:hypothetical protein
MGSYISKVEGDVVYGAIGAVAAPAALNVVYYHRSVNYIPTDQTQMVVMGGAAIAGALVAARVGNWLDPQ